MKAIFVVVLSILAAASAAPSPKIAPIAPKDLDEFLDAFTADAEEIRAAEENFQLQLWSFLPADVFLQIQEDILSVHEEQLNQDVLTVSDLMTLFAERETPLQEVASRLEWTVYKMEQDILLEGTFTDEYVRFEDPIIVDLIHGVVEQYLAAAKMTNLRQVVEKYINTQ